MTNRTQTSQRPIVFIGYSLGGLIIKQACYVPMSRNEKTNNNLRPWYMPAQIARSGTQRF